MSYYVVKSYFSKLYLYIISLGPTLGNDLSFKKKEQKYKLLYSQLDLVNRKQDLSYPQEMSTRNEKTIDDANYGVSQATTDMKELKINEDIDGGPQLVIKQENEKLTENQAILDSVKPTEGNKDSKNIEDVGGSQIKLTEDEGIMDISKPIEANDNLDSIQEDKNEQSITESGTSGLNQNSDDPIASAAQQELVVEEVPIDSSSSSSPTSVLAGKIPTDQASSSTSDQQLHIVILQSHLEDIANTYSWDEQPPLNITPAAQPVVENFTAPPSNNSGFENLMVSIPIAINDYFCTHIISRKKIMIEANEAWPYF